MKQILAISSLLAVTAGVFAQGNNTRLGGADGNYQSVVERVTNLEKKNDMFNFYLNYSAAARADEYDGDWTSGFTNKQLRLELKGNLTDKLSYRFRHRLNKSNAAMGQDNFAKATDIMMIGYKFNDKLSVQAGKMCQIWGGFEFDVNPMFIYRYSDMVDNMDNFMAGIVLSYKPIASQELAFEVSNAYNGKFSDFYPNAAAQGFQKADHPLTYIVNWNGSFLDNVLQTRWAWGLQTQADNKYSRMLTLGQQLNFGHFQWYVDYMGAFDDIDRLGIASGELSTQLGGKYATKVHYNSIISKADWQFVPQWNIFVKGTYETASLVKVDQFKDYRKSIGYLAGIEYYPDQSQDLRFSLTYLGHKYNYSEKCGLKDYNTNSIEVGFMYRIKCY